MYRAMWVGIAGALLLLAAGCSRAPSDALLTADTRNRIGSDARLQGQHLQVSASHGILTLSGNVASDADRFAAAEDVGRAEGLKVLVNNLRVAEQVTEKDRPIEIGKPIRVSLPIRPVKPEKPSPAVEKKAEPSSLPIVTDSSPQASSSEQHQVLVPDPSATVVNPAASLPTYPMVPTSTAATVDSNQPGPSSTSTSPAPEKIVIPYSTILSVRLLDTVSSDSNDVGDKFTASLASPVMVNDSIVIPAEAGIHGKVVEVQSSGRFSGKPSLAIELNEIAYNGKTYSLRTSQFSKEGKSRTTRSAETIGGGAGIGAILGGMLGGGRGAAIGAAIGAGVGTGVQAKSRGSQVELPAETILSFRLKGPLEVEAASTLHSSPSTDPGSSADPFPNDRPVLKRRPGSGAADPAPDATSPNTASAPDRSPDNDTPPVLKRRPD